MKLDTRPRMIYRDCWRYFLEPGSKWRPRARDKLQYHTLVHFLTNRRRGEAKRDRPSCRCSSGNRKLGDALVPERAPLSYSLRSKSLPPSCSGHITGSRKKFLLSETCANATSFRHVVSPRRPMIIDTAIARATSASCFCSVTSEDEDPFFLAGANVTSNRSADLIEL